MQRISCSVYQNQTLRASSPEQGKGGKPGVSHAEQKAWNASDIVIARGDTIKFDVDGPICQGCTAWFENTLYPLISGGGGTLIVQCNRDDFYAAVKVTGPGTNWGNVGEAGYYGPGGAGKKQ